MATSSDVIRDRITSICAGIPFQFLTAATPFDFDLQPTGGIEGAFRVTTESEDVIGGFNYTEERTDRLEIWVARKQPPGSDAGYRALLTDCSSLRAAIVRDGATGGGEYCVPDGTSYGITHEDGREYAVLRLSIPVNYEAEL